MAATSRYEDNASFILVTGVTGAGKSYFINKIAGREVAGEGHSLTSCTAVAAAIAVTIGREKVILVDTPGFDDTTRSDSEILQEISKLLTFQYESGLQLKGVIFLHRITDNRWQGSSMKTLQICRNMCGVNALKNVILVTSRWNEIDARTGAQREAQLRNEIWKFMLDFGSTMMRYHGDKDSAVAITSQLLRKDRVVLDLQRELVDEGKLLSDTVAGSSMNHDIENRIEEERAEYKKKIKELDDLRNDILKDRPNMMYSMQQEIETERKKLELKQSQEYTQQLALQVPIAEEVRRQVKQAEKKKGRLSKILQFLPSCLSMIGLFVGIPPGTFETLSSWFSGTGFEEFFTDLFSSF